MTGHLGLKPRPPRVGFRLEARRPCQELSSRLAVTSCGSRPLQASTRCRSSPWDKCTCVARSRNGPRIHRSCAPEHCTVFHSELEGLEQMRGTGPSKPVELSRRHHPNISSRRMGPRQYALLCRDWDARTMLKGSVHLYSWNTWPAGRHGAAT